MTFQWEAKAWEVYSSRLSYVENVKNICRATGMKESTCRVYAAAIHEGTSVSEYIKTHRADRRISKREKSIPMDPDALDMRLDSQGVVEGPEVLEERISRMEELLSDLSPKERGVIESHFFYGQKLQAIGYKVNLTKARIGQIVDETLQKLHRKVMRPQF